MPVAITVFPDEVIRAQEAWARRAFPTLSYFNEVDRGGHFARDHAAERMAPEGIRPPGLDPDHLFDVLVDGDHLLVTDDRVEPDLVAGEQQQRDIRERAGAQAST